MHIRRGFVPKRVLERLLSAANDKKGDTSAFHVSKPLRLIPNGLLLFGLGLYILDLAGARTAGPQYFIVAAGAVLAFFLTANIAQILWNFRVSRAFALLTSRVLIVVDGTGLSVQPVWDFERIEVVREDEAGMALQFKFAKGALRVRYFANQRQEAESFVQRLITSKIVARQLLAEVPLAERIRRNAWEEWRDADLLPEYPAEAKYGLVGQGHQAFTGDVRVWRRELTASALTGVVLFLAVPELLDYNAYRWAVEQGSATAYREYLAGDQHVRYREKARSAIKSLYDGEIEKYTSRANGLAGAEAFVAMLRYLSDRNLYEVPVTFQSESAVANIAMPGLPHLVSVAPSFTSERNLARERAVVKKIKDTLGRFFPADVMTVDTWRNQEGPRIAVSYRYGNKAGSLYYPVAQEAKVPRDRTWYYGIEIQWALSLHLPTSPDPLHSFSFRSEPAPEFSVRQMTAESVYDRMAETAFEDFVQRFDADFLIKRG